MDYILPPPDKLGFRPLFLLCSKKVSFWPPPKKFRRRKTDYISPPPDMLISNNFWGSGADEALGDTSLRITLDGATAGEAEPPSTGAILKIVGDCLLEVFWRRSINRLLAYIVNFSDFRDVPKICAFA